VRVRVRIAEGDDVGGELRSLTHWLEREDELRGTFEVESRPVGADEMGVLSDTLVVAVGGGGAVTVLANSLSVWLRQRRSDVRIEVTSASGTKVSVTAERVEDAAAVIETVLRSDG